jgi:hypothetical protein
MRSTKPMRITPMDKPILLTIGGHTLRRLWEPLSETYDLAFLQTHAAQMAETMGLKAIVLERLLASEMVGESKAHAMTATAEIVSAAKTGTASLDANVPTLTGEGLLTWLPPMFYDHMVTALARLHALEALARTRNIAGVLVHEDVTPEGRLLTQFGKAIGVPTLHIPHANHYIKPSAYDIHCQIDSGYMGVAGEYMRDWYVECGADPERITILGTPQYDYLYDTDTIPNKESARRAFHVPEGKRVIGYGTSWHQMTAVWGDGPKELERCWNAVLSACKTTDSHLIVHVHYAEQPDRQQWYSDRMKEAEVKGCVHRGDGLFWSLQASDVVVVPSASNYGLEAAILGKPVAELWTPGARFPKDGPEGTWGEDLVEVIERAKPLPEWAKRMNAYSDGTDRAVEWVVGLCR